MRNGVEKVYDHTSWSFIASHVGFGGMMPCLAFMLGSGPTSHVMVNGENSKRYLILQVGHFFANFYFTKVLSNDNVTHFN